MNTDYRERAFEEHVERELEASGGFLKIAPHQYRREWALFPELVLQFLAASQPTAMADLRRIHQAGLYDLVLGALRKELERTGVVNVLRHGFKFYGKTLRMAFFRPETSLNEEAQRLYEKNCLGVTRQLRYSEASENSVDILLSVNGLPVCTVELKNPLTGQDVEHAKRQYRFDRDPRETLFGGKRAFVHFAVDPNLVFMATRLAGAETRFLPFNRGTAGGGGNPENSRGYRTSYLWTTILERHSLMDIIRRFIHIEESTVPGTKRTRETVIFPRFHQLECVRNLVSAVGNEGPGQNYLIQHSAGSGKSNSIAWLAHRLSDLHDRANKRIFDSVIVVTDRVVLDRQLQDTIYQFEHADGVVERITEDSQQLAAALASGRPIIITTLQKFPFVVDKVGSLNDRHYAIIVDEAHSSQSGEAAKDLRQVLRAQSLDEAEAESEARQSEPEQWQDAVARVAAARARQPNVSFFAFTATPKAKTLEVFGRRDADGKPRPFHLYSMRQAIEEGFILDVLANYTTYKAFYRLVKQASADPLVPKRQATAGLARFLSLHPHNLAQKTEVIIEHFRNYTAPRIGGQAKGMVVTASRLHAVRYKQSFDRYIDEKGYKGIRTLVAFSGRVIDPDDRSLEYTEASMNGIRESEVPQRFGSPDYQILLVAEKYQTGFDQPLLHTMYVDKRLKGLHAVQTLSRLNRTHPGKEETFVLDFVNAPDEIAAAFQPYYEATLIEETTDPQHLYQLQAELDDMRVYTGSEVENFCRTFFAPTSGAGNLEHPELYRWINPALDRFRNLSYDDQDEFKNRLKAFVSLYSFVSQIVTFTDTDLEKRYTYVRFLGRTLPRRGAGPRAAFDDDVALRYYRLQKMTEGNVQLQKAGGATIRGLTDVGTAAGKDPEDLLSKIVDLVNQKYGTDWTNADQLFIDQVRAETLADDELLDSARINSEENFRFKLDKTIEEKFIGRMDQNTAIFEKFMADPEFQNAIRHYLIRSVYDHLKKK